MRKRVLLLHGSLFLQSQRSGKERTSTEFFKKEITRTGNIPVLWEAFSILISYLHSYSSILSMARWKTILVIDVEHDSSACGAVPNEQVCGIVFDYKQLFSDY